MIQLHSFQIGPSHAARWVIKTNKDLYWNGQGWSPYGDDALLFHDCDEADQVINELMKALFESMPVWNYRTHVEVEVYGFVKPTLQSLKDHLWENQTLPLIFDDDGPETSIVLSIVKWDSLREVQS